MMRGRVWMGYAQASKSQYRHPLEPQVISVGAWARLQGSGFCSWRFRRGSSAVEPVGLAWWLGCPCEFNLRI